MKQAVKRKSKKIDLFKELIDGYVELYSKLKSIQDELNSIKEQILNQVGDFEKSIEISGYDHSLKIYKSVRITLNPEKVFTKVGKSVFLRISKVSTDKARKILNSEEFNECIESINEYVNFKIGG